MEVAEGELLVDVEVIQSAAAASRIVLLVLFDGVIENLGGDLAEKGPLSVEDVELLKK